MSNTIRKSIVLFYMFASSSTRNKVVLYFLTMYVVSTFHAVQSILDYLTFSYTVLEIIKICIWALSKIFLFFILSKSSFDNILISLVVSEIWPIFQKMIFALAHAHKHLRYWNSCSRFSWFFAVNQILNFENPSIFRHFKFQEIS